MTVPGTREERRRSVRFNCAGVVKMIRLPSDGASIPATLRDLSLHGCCIEPSLPIHCGARTEIVIRVNASSFRAVGEVKAKRDGSIAGLEFLQISAGGQVLLDDMIADLKRWQVLMRHIRSSRVDSRIKRLLESQNVKRSAAELLQQTFLPDKELLAELQAASAAGESTTAEKESPTVRIAEIVPVTVAVDLFG